MLGKKALLEILESGSSKIISMPHVFQRFTESMKHCPTTGVHRFAFSYQSLVLKNCQGLYCFLRKNRFTLTLNKKNLPTNVESSIFDNLRFPEKNTGKSYTPKVTFMFIQLQLQKERHVFIHHSSPRDAFTYSGLSGLPMMPCGWSGFSSEWISQRQTTQSSPGRCPEVPCQWRCSVFVHWGLKLFPLGSHTHSYQTKSQPDV